MLLADSVREEVEIGAAPERGAPDPAELLEALGLDALGHQPPSQLSAGEARRLSVAAMLAGAPDLMILDEPAAGLHPEARETVMSLAAERCRSGASLLLITHDADLVRRHADRVVVLREGCVVADGRPVAQGEATCDRCRPAM